ncbi:MAG TPA: toll/interleukin-1 receptor domain-containing protein [Bryobacteraceae bacterium]|nr:toll/interleukin-1 receptor domain-containing protein [Bryobacteraceae bacterium]
MNDSAWKRLIEKIHESNVVPILGPRLLVGADGQSSLEAQIAQSVLDRSRNELEASGRNIGAAPLPPFRELNELVARLRGIVDPQDLYDYVHEAIREATSSAKFEIPAPIRQLSEIADFRLFVTLTPDDLLARSLRRRCTVQEVVHSPSLPTSEGRDLPRDWKERPGEAYVLYLFGKARSAPMFAIHDEDVLEYAHNVITRGSQVPTGFLDELQQRNLLLVGCNFPDWLTRFFLRATNRKRLSEKANRSWVIEPLLPEESLTCFLRSYSKETEILSQTPPVEFVAELHQRWMAEHGAGLGSAGRQGEEVIPRGAMFFISYSRGTDQARAQELFQALLGLGVTESEVWFDRNSVEPGEDFKRRIIEGIHGCRYFLPLLSRAADSREEGFVFTEWREASERKRGMNREFLLPIIVDVEYEPEKYQSRPVWEWRQQSLHFGHASQGDPDNQLVDKLRNLVRDARRGSAA